VEGEQRVACDEKKGKEVFIEEVRYAIALEVATGGSRLSISRSVPYCYGRVGREKSSAARPEGVGARKITDK